MQARFREIVGHPFTFASLIRTKPQLHSLCVCVQRVARVQRASQVASQCIKSAKAILAAALPQPSNEVVESTEPQYTKYGVMRSSRPDSATGPRYLDWLRPKSAAVVSSSSMSGADETPAPSSTWRDVHHSPNEGSRMGFVTPASVEVETRPTTHSSGLTNDGRASSSSTAGRAGSANSKGHNVTLHSIHDGQGRSLMWAAESALLT